MSIWKRLLGKSKVSPPVRGKVIINPLILRSNLGAANLSGATLAGANGATAMGTASRVPSPDNGATSAPNSIDDILTATAVAAVVDAASSDQPFESAASSDSSSASSDQPFESGGGSFGGGGSDASW